MQHSAEQPGRGARSRLAELRAIARQQGEPAAEAALVEMIREEPNSAELLVTLARLLNRQKRLDDAEKVADRAVQLAPLDPRMPVLAGFIQIRREQPARAAGYFAEAIRLDPNMAEAHLGLATVKMLEEDYETALRFCDRALDLDSSLDRAYELVARINYRQGRNDLARAELGSILEENPRNERVLRAYLRLLREDGKNDEAVAFLEKAIGAEQDSRHASRLAQLAIRAGQASFAVRHYRKVIENGSKHPVNRIRFILALIEGDATEEAAAEIARLGEIRGMRPAVHALNGELAFRRGDFEDAVRAFRDACAALPNAEPIAPGGETGATPEEEAKRSRKHALAEIRSAVRARLDRRRGARPPAGGRRAARALAEAPGNA